MKKLLYSFILGISISVFALTSCGRQDFIRHNHNVEYTDWGNTSYITWRIDDLPESDKWLFDASPLADWLNNSRHYVSIIKWRDKYYLAPFGGERVGHHAMVIPYEDVPKLIAYIDAAMDKMEEVKNSMKSAGVKEVDTGAGLHVDWNLYWFNGAWGNYFDAEVHSNIKHNDFIHISGNEKSLIIKTVYNNDETSQFLDYKLNIIINKTTYKSIMSILKDSKYMKELLDEHIADKKKQAEFEANL